MSRHSWIYFTAAAVIESHHEFPLKVALILKCLQLSVVDEGEAHHPRVEWHIEFQQSMLHLVPGVTRTPLDV